MSVKKLNAAATTQPKKLEKPALKRAFLLRSKLASYKRRAMTKKSTTVRLSGGLVCASPQEVEIIKKFLPEHMRLTKAETGCLSFEITQTNDPLVWRVEERFIDQQAFEQHQQCTRDSAWWQATSKISRDYKISS